MGMSKIKLIGFITACFAVGALGIWQTSQKHSAYAAEDPQIANAAKMIREGRQTFRFDTFGDEAFWGDTLKLHEAVEGASLGGVGPGLSPRNALALGLKVDIAALLPELKERVMAGNSGPGQAKLNQAILDDAAITVALLRANAVIGLKGVFDSSGGLNSIGIQCALCHSTVDDSIAPGIGRRLDGWANRDLNVGAIVALAPNLQPVADLLGVDVGTVRKVLMAWGPGKFDAELFLDGKGFRPDGNTAAVLIPPAFGLAGVNLHTWTGWGSIPYWNAFVATLEMHGKGSFSDSRLSDPSQFPIAARAGLDNVRSEPDLVSSKLPALHRYQLALAAPRPPHGSFNEAAAERGG